MGETQPVGPLSLGLQPPDCEKTHSRAEPARPCVLLQLHELTDTWAPHTPTRQRPSCVSASALSLPHPSLAGPSKLQSTGLPSPVFPSRPCTASDPTLNPEASTPWVQPSVWTDVGGCSDGAELTQHAAGGFLTLPHSERGEATPREGMLSLAQLQADPRFIWCSGGVSEAKGHAAVRFLAHKAL